MAVPSDNSKSTILLLASAPALKADGLIDHGLTGEAVVVALPSGMVLLCVAIPELVSTIFLSMRCSRYMPGNSQG